MSIFTKLFNAIKEAFDGIPKHIKVYASQSLAVTSKIRSWLSSGVAVAITDLIPGEWDDNARKAIINAIDKSLPYLLIVDTCKDKPTTQEMLECWVSELQKHPKHIQDALLLKLAALITAMQDNAELRQNLYDTYTQMAVSANK